MAVRLRMRRAAASMFSLPALPNLPFSRPFVMQVRRLC
jgi:hypothetical protein